MAHAWKACWCNSLTSSNLVSSARIGAPETVEIIRFPGFCFGSFRLSVPSRFPPGTLRFDTFGPDPPRVSHIGTDDSENAFEPSPAVCSSSKSDCAPCVPSVGRFESLHVFRAVFFVLVRNNPSLRIASASQRIPVGPARRFPLTPSDERHTNAYGCHESPFEPSIDSLIHRQEAKERSSVGWVRGDNGKPRRHPSPGYSPANGTGTAMTAKEKT